MKNVDMNYWRNRVAQFASLVILGFTVGAGFKGNISTQGMSILILLALVNILLAHTMKKGWYEKEGKV